MRKNTVAYGQKATAKPLSSINGKCHLLIPAGEEAEVNGMPVRVAASN